MLALTASVAGCGKPEPMTATAETPPPAPPPPPPETPSLPDSVTVDLSAKGTEIQLHTGQTLVVRLTGESPSTGYGWRVVSNPSHHMAQLDRGSIPDHPPPAPGQPPLVGGGNTAVFTFKAQSPGKALLKLALFPPGRRRKPVAFFDLRIVVG